MKDISTFTPFDTQELYGYGGTLTNRLDFGEKLFSTFDNPYFAIAHSPIFFPK